MDASQDILMLQLESLGSSRPLAKVQTLADGCQASNFERMSVQGLTWTVVSIGPIPGSYGIWINLNPY
ncbi:hypothetical protein PGT21_027580 [Puccinia graminis f. sp. tritici]|uniref:Uncharacterized protein n=1 Tax=Puccinia graminis f. sp. tritici TaxID=56615 RepID=A0A5B0QGH7_PUCGR|nr:hypothetical protein PGTUg99_010682 [Puccinia graminis f. sp. tritici]KAA1117935.1 hypothetical protein PGT21_027580 [Puccinia graminis f. sp. tritici]